MDNFVMKGILTKKHTDAGLYLVREGEYLHLKDGKTTVHTWLWKNATYHDILNQADWHILKTMGVPA
jgi:hypothetical protein